MIETNKERILAVARKAVHTEMLALRHLEENLDDRFVEAVALILECRGKCIITGMGKSGLVGRKIAATLYGRSAGKFEIAPHFVGDDVRERCLTQAGRAV